ncbi:MAG: pirin family protein [Thermoanaerobaculia bacterium]
MITIRKSDDRGHFDHGWLDTRHTFSFADYWDPEHVNFRALRVLNEDRVVPSAGFGTHGHNDMEIVSYVLSGTLAHKDSMGNGSTIVPGDVQYMSAGTGVRHSEFNASEKEPVHFVQIWIVPDRRGYAPRYGQKTFAESEKRGKLRLVASGTGDDGSIAIRQDASLYATVLRHGESVPLEIAKGRHLWVQVLRGEADVNGNRLSAGDGLAASDESAFTLRGAGAEAELLVFDLA